MIQILITSIVFTIGAVVGIITDRQYKLETLRTKRSLISRLLSEKACWRKEQQAYQENIQIAQDSINLCTDIIDSMHRKVKQAEKDCDDWKKLYYTLFNKYC